MGEKRRFKLVIEGPVTRSSNFDWRLGTLAVLNPAGIIERFGEVFKNETSRKASAMPLPKDGYES